MEAGKHPLEIIRTIFHATPEQLEEVKSVMVEEHMPAGTVINSHIYVPHYYIKSGAARTFYIEKGKEHTVSFAFDDEYLVTYSRMLPVDREVLIMFMDDSDVIYSSPERMRAVLENFDSPDTQAAMMMSNAALLNYVSTLEERIFSLLHANAAERYAWAIRKYPRLLECATTTQIASFLGLTRETLYRIRSGTYPSQR